MFYFILFYFFCCNGQYYTIINLQKRVLVRKKIVLRKKHIIKELSVYSSICHIRHLFNRVEIPTLLSVLRRNKHVHNTVTFII